MRVHIVGIEPHPRIHLRAQGELTVGTPAVGAYRLKWERGGHRSQMQVAGAP